MSKVVREHFDQIAKDYDYYKQKNKFYYDNLKKLLRNFIPANKVVLEIGCGTGELLSSVNPKEGYGIDISKKMIKIAKRKYGDKKNLYFSTSDITTFKRISPDYIFMSDVIEHLEDPQEVFNQINRVMSKQARFICTMANPRWEPILMLAEKFMMKMPEGEHYRWKYSEIKRFLKKSGLKINTHGYKLLVPINVPFHNFVNKWLERFFVKYAFIEYFIARKN